MNKKKKKTKKKDENKTRHCEEQNSRFSCNKFLAFLFATVIGSGPRFDDLDTELLQDEE